MYIYIQRKTTIYFVKDSGLSPLSVTLFFSNRLHYFSFINLHYYAKIHYKFYNNYKCHHRNKINVLPIKKIMTYLLNCNKRIEKNIRDNDSSDGTKQLLK